LKFRGMRLKYSLFIYNTGLTLFALLVSGTLLLALEVNYTKSHEREQLLIYARSLAEQIAPFMLPELQYEQVSAVVGMYAELGDFQARVYDNERILIAQSTNVDIQGRPTVGTVHPRPSGQANAGFRAISDGSNAVWHITRRTDTNLSALDIRYVCNLPIQEAPPEMRSAQIETGTDNTRPYGVRTFIKDQRSVIAEIESSDRVVGYIELLHLNDHVISAMRFLPTAILLAASISLALSLAFGSLAGRGMTKSLTDLGRQTALIAAGDLTVRTRPDIIPIKEARELCEAFNTMTDRIREMIDERDADRQTIRNFLDDVAHEMRTPLSAISNYVELIQGAAAEDEPARIKFLSECGRQIDKLEWLNKNLLSQARLDSGVQKYNKSPHHAIDVLKEAVESRRTEFEKKSIVLEETIEREELIVSCDREWLVIALSNILDNAIKFAPNNSCIHVGVGSSSDQKAVVFSIADQGPGISPEQLPFIFERFYRGSVVGAGCGLGLAMTKSIVTRHSGHVLVDSILGKGSTFTITLPNLPESKDISKS